MAGEREYQAEMMRRLKDAMKESEGSAHLLGERISRLTLWLPIFTIAICGLTVVLVAAELARAHFDLTTGLFVLMTLEDARHEVC